MKGVPSKHVDRAYATSKRRGTVGRNAVVPRLAYLLTDADDQVLDFGAGRDAYHTKMLRFMGRNCTAYEFPQFANRELHDLDALERTYDVVLLSNVLNVQGSSKMLAETLKQVKSACRQGTVLLANYPSAPRKLLARDGKPVSAEKLERILQRTFKAEIERVHGSKRAPVWLVIVGGGHDA